MIYLHIGLHKTATTSLQTTLFPYLKDINYLGRGKDNGNEQLYEDISEYCFSKSDNELRKVALRQELLKIDENILLSDEWFTSDYSGRFLFEGCTWQEKIRRLSELVQGLECKVLLSLRAPVEGLYSQYCEFLTVGIGKTYPNFKNYINSNDAKAYNYHELDRIINDQFGNVTYLHFEHIMNGNYQAILSGFFDIEEIPRVEKKNSRNQTSKSIELKENSVILLKLMHILPPIIKITLKKITWVRRLKLLLHNLLERNFKVSKLSDVEKNEYLKSFESSMVFYEKTLK